MFGRARVEESAARARSHKARIMAGYKNGTEIYPKEEVEEENSEGNLKQPATNLIGRSHIWEKEITAGARLEKRGEPGRVWNRDIGQT